MSAAPPPQHVDPYLDPATGVLRNLVGARNQVALDTIESDLVFARVMQLLDHPPEPTGDLDELCAIHRHLFQDVYDWAGKPRTVDIRKNVSGAEFFIAWSRIPIAAVYVAEQLRRDHALRGLPRHRFVARLAHHYGEFNYVHPFREGNGRTHRVFWGRVAQTAGWQLDWRRVHGAVNDRASSAAMNQDYEPLRAMFDSIVVTAPDSGPPTAALLAFTGSEPESDKPITPPEQRPRP
jgi:cell filamentation protein